MLSSLLRLLHQMPIQACPGLQSCLNNVTLRTQLTPTTVPCYMYDLFTLGLVVACNQPGPGRLFLPMLAVAPAEIAVFVSSKKSGSTSSYFRDVGPITLHCRL